MLSYALLISVYHSYLSFRSSSFYLFRLYTANVLHIDRFCEKRPLNHIITDLNRIYHSNRRTHKNNGYCVTVHSVLIAILVNNAKNAAPPNAEQHLSSSELVLDVWHHRHMTCSLDSNCQCSLMFCTVSCNSSWKDFSSFRNIFS